ncbi:MAG: porin [Sulfurovum sp.]|nr:porin [Sulfurovum sp.]
MKKALLLSVVASTMMMAGGDIAPVEEPMIIEDNGFYLGLGYGFMNAEVEGGLEFGPMGPVGIPGYDEDFSSVMVQAGYKFNSYFAVEGRYWFGLDDASVLGFADVIDAPDAWGIYAKPIFPVTEDFDIYGLAGYADVDLNGFSDRNTDGFSWGLGASYDITESFSVFADYVALVDDTIAFRDVNVETINVGVSYLF